MFLFLVARSSGQDLAVEHWGAIARLNGSALRGTRGSTATWRPTTGAARRSGRCLRGDPVAALLFYQLWKHPTAAAIPTSAPLWTPVFLRWTDMTWSSVVRDGVALPGSSTCATSSAHAEP